MDDKTSTNNRGKFLRICVEVNLEKPAREGVWIGQEGNDFFQVIAYENLPVFCTYCGCIGHKKQDWLKKVHGESKEDEVDTSREKRCDRNIRNANSTQAQRAAEANP